LILIVDDNTDTADLLVRLLRRSGLAAHPVGGGADALDYLHNGDGGQADHAALPNLVILDVMMPGMDGITCLRAIRSEWAWADLPVIMYTADFSLERMQQAMRFGAVGYIVKGTTPWTDVLALIQQHCRKDVRN
jgi:CheY-like chemotaxis protein